MPDADKAHGLAWRAQSALHFGTDGHPFHEAPERVGEKRVALVSPVVADHLTQQARGDANPNRLIRRGGCILSHDGSSRPDRES